MGYFAIINWTPTEFLIAVVGLLIVYPICSTIAAFVDNQVQHYYEKWFKK